MASELPDDASLIMRVLMEIREDVGDILALLLDEDDDESEEEG